MKKLINYWPLLLGIISIVLFIIGFRLDSSKETKCGVVIDKILATTYHKSYSEQEFQVVVKFDDNTIDNISTTSQAYYTHSNGDRICYLLHNKVNQEKALVYLLPGLALLIISIIGGMLKIENSTL